MLCPPARSSLRARGELRGAERQQSCWPQAEREAHSTALTTTGMSEPVETLTLRWLTARKKDWMTPP